MNPAAARTFMRGSTTTTNRIIAFPLSLSGYCLGDQACSERFWTKLSCCGGGADGSKNLWPSLATDSIAKYEARTAQKSK